MRSARQVGTWCAVAAALTGCGISSDGRITPIRQSDLGAALANTTTTTTTIVTIPPSSVAPPVIESTVPLIDTRDVTVYYAVRGSGDAVKRVDIPRLDPNLNDVVDLLSNPSTELAPLDMRSAVAPGLFLSTPTLDEGVAAVDLDPAVFDVMSDADQRLAIAQIVLTLTSFVTSDQGGIGAVVLTKGGEGIRVPLPGVGSSEVGEELSFQDFRSLFEPNGPATTTTTTAVPESSPPTPTSIPPAIAPVG